MFYEDRMPCDYWIHSFLISIFQLIYSTAFFIWIILKEDCSLSTEKESKQKRTKANRLSPLPAMWAAPVLFHIYGDVLQFPLLNKENHTLLKFKLAWILVILFCSWKRGPLHFLIAEEVCRMNQLKYHVNN